MWDDDWGRHGDMGWAGWLFMSLWTVLLIALLAALVVYLIRVSAADRRSRGTPSAGRSRAGDLLDERFARGEIDEEEYRRRRETLDRS